MEEKKSTVEDCVAVVRAHLVLELPPPLRIICVPMSEYEVVKSSRTTSGRKHERGSRKATCRPAVR